MQIVINIPEYIYDYIKRLNSVGHMDYRTSVKLYDAVAKGIPLPKGHGALKDADALIDSLGGR